MVKKKKTVKKKQGIPKQQQHSKVSKREQSKQKRTQHETVKTAKKTRKRPQRLIETETSALGQPKNHHPAILAAVLLIIAIATYLTYYPSLSSYLTNWDDNSYVEENPLLQETYDESGQRQYNIKKEKVKRAFSPVLMFKMLRLGYLADENDPQVIQERNELAAELYHMGNYHPMTMLSLGIDTDWLTTDKVRQKGERLRQKREEADKKRAQESGIPYESNLPTDLNQLNEHQQKIYNFEPYIYHLRNLIFHIINTLLVFWVVYVLFAQASANARLAIAAITALLFGLNAIHVESVAWVSERKDVLYTFFYLISLICYIYYLRVKGRAIQLTLYVAAIVIFLLSLYSKAQAVSLAVTLILVDWFLGRKVLSKKAILDKIPFFVLALIFGLVAIKAQLYGEAVHEVDEYGYGYRVLFAAYGFMQYFIKMLYPHDLAAIYPYPHMIGGVLDPDFFNYPLWLNLVFVVLVAAAGIWAYKRAKSITFALAFFLINVFLVLQLLPVGSAIMADRYAYVPSLGFFLLFGIGFGYLLNLRKITWAKYAGMLVLAVFSIYSAYAAYQQTLTWRDSMSLWDNTIEHSPTALVAFNNRGSTKEKLGDKKGAILDFTEAIRLKPDYTHAFYNRGTAKKDYAIKFSNDLEEKIKYLESAIDDFDKALTLDPNLVEGYHNRGIAKEQLADLIVQRDRPKYINLAKEKAQETGNNVVDLLTGYMRENRYKYLRMAIEDYDKGLSANPAMANLYTSRGIAKGKMGDMRAAIRDFNKCIALQPRQPEAYSNRGFAYMNLDMPDSALFNYDKAVQLNPYSEESRYNRGVARFRAGDLKGALEDYNMALRIKPNFDDVLYNRGNVYLEMGKKREACTDFKAAFDLRGNSAAQAKAALEEHCGTETNTTGGQ